MGYVDKYEQYLKEVPADAARCTAADKFPVFAYTSDLDVLMEWDLETFNRILDRHLVSAPSFSVGDTIGSMEDFARIFSYYAIRGLGGECDITNIEVCNILEDLFQYEYALGGTGAQGAAALAAMKIPLLAHITDRSSEVCDLMSDASITFINGKERIPASEHASGEPPVRHMILMFNKGDVIRALGKEYIVPVSNRLIMDYDKIHKIVPIREDFLQYCEDHAESITSYDISGFNAILDLSVAKDRMAHLSGHFKRIKEKNPDCIIYLEGAHYFNPEIKDYVFRESSAFSDVIGMNEEELADLTEKLGARADITDIRSIISSLEGIENTYGMDGIVMHTKDYSLYYGNRLDGANIEKGLTIGNLMSGTRARTGRYGSYEDCRETLRLELSPSGLKFSEMLENMDVKKTCCLVPSRYMEKPACTIGLGDTFVAGMQTSFL